MIDLDVLTVAFWDKDKDAIEFLERVRTGEFEVYIPYTLLEILEKWKYDKLKQNILEFYKTYSLKILSTREIVEKSKKINVDYEKVIKELIRNGVKEEDAILVFVTSVFSLDYLVSYNRTHLKNKERTINLILERNRMRVIKIVIPKSI